MPSEQTIQIIIRATSADAQKQVEVLKASLQSMGVQMKETKRETDAHGESLAKVNEVANKLIARYFGLEAAIRLATEAWRRLTDFIKQSIGAVEQFHNQTVALAGIMTDLTAHKGPQTWAENFRYANAEMERLRQKAAEVGVSWKAMEMVSRSFADVGIVPGSDKELEAMVGIAKQAQFIAVTRRQEIGSVMQIKQLLEGQVSAGNQLATVLGHNLGLNEEQLKQWIQLHERQGDILIQINKHMGVSKEMADEVSRSLTVQGEIFQDNLHHIERMAAGGAWGAITEALRKANEWLTKNSHEVIAILEPAFRNLGNTIAQAITYATAHWQDFAKAIAASIDALSLVLKNVINIGIAITNLINRWTALNDVISRTIHGETGPVDTSGVLAAARARVAGTKGFDAQGNIVQAGQAFPSHPDLMRGFLDSGKGTGAANEAFRAALDNLRQWYAHQLAVNQTIDDAVARQRDLIRILEEARAKYIAVRNAAAGKHLLDEQRQAQDEINRIENQAIVERYRLDRLAVTQKIQNAKEYLAYLQSVNAISLQDTVAYYDRMLKYAGLTAQQITEIERAKAVVLHKIHEEETKAYRQQLELQLKEFKDNLRQQTDALQEQADAANIARERAGILKGLSKPLYGNLGVADTTAQDQAIAASQAQQALTAQIISQYRQEAEHLRQIAASITDVSVKQQYLDEATRLETEARKQTLALEKEQNQELAQRVSKYQELMKPIHDSVEAVQKTIEGSFLQMWDSVIEGSQSVGEALLNFFRNIGRSIINEIGQYVAKAFTNMIMGAPGSGGLGDMLSNMFKGLNNWVNPGASAAIDQAQAALTQEGAGTTMLSAASIQADAAAQMMVAAQMQAAGGGAVGGAEAGGLFDVAHLLLRAEGGTIPGPLVPLMSFASGGVVSRPTLAMIGEGGGPEAVVPLKRGALPVEISGGRGGNTYYIQAIDVDSFRGHLYSNREFLAEMHGEQKSVYDRNVRR